jgi:hypothetical protein
MIEQHHLLNTVADLIDKYAKGSKDICNRKNVMIKMRRARSLATTSFSRLHDILKMFGVLDVKSY